MDSEKVLRDKPMAQLNTPLQVLLQGWLSRGTVALVSWGFWCLWHLCGLCQAHIGQTEDHLCTRFLLPLLSMVLFLLSSCCMEMQWGSPSLQSHSLTVEQWRNGWCLLLWAAQRWWCSCLFLWKWRLKISFLPPFPFSNQSSVCVYVSALVSVLLPAWTQGSILH